MMGVIRSFSVKCDACGYEHSRTSTHVGHLVKEMRLDGWSVSSSRTVCKDCREQAKNNKKQEVASE